VSMLTGIIIKIISPKTRPKLIKESTTQLKSTLYPPSKQQIHDQSAQQAQPQP
jgi:hypothetical protein